MLAPKTAPARRADVAGIFDYLAGQAGQVDVSAANGPLEQFLTIVRALATRYDGIAPQPPRDDVRIIETRLGGVRGDWIMAPGADPNRRLMWIHGGGWVAGPIDGYHRDVAATLSRATGISVFLPDYRLAPEHRFPAGLEDCHAALAAMADTAPDGAARTASNLYLAGDSAGGNLAGATCLLAQARGTRLPDRLIIVAGMMDNVQTVDRVGADDPVCPVDAVEASLALYLPEGVKPYDPLVSPVYADPGILAALPPTLIQASSTEALLYDCLRFADALRAAHVRTVMSVWPGLPHVWHAFQSTLPESGEAIAEISAFLKP